MKIIVRILLLTFVATLVSCSGSKTSSTTSTVPPMPNISGNWEFVAVSTASSGYSTAVEAALQQAQVFDSTTGLYNEASQISASGAQLGFVGLNNLGGNASQSIVFGGNCTAASNTFADALSGSITGLAGSMNFTYTEAGNTFNVVATLSADGKSMAGTYSEQAPEGGQTNGVCSGSSLDDGNITGAVASKLSGTYFGQLCEPLDTLCTAGAKDSATATLSESSSGNLTVNMVLTGVDNATFTLTGTATANVFSVQGTFMGSTVSYDGYFQNAYDQADGLYDIPTLYLANVDLTTTPPSPTYAGTLTVPQTP
jgi:hypothetical protein